MQVAGNSSQKRSSVGSTVIDPWTDSMNSEPTSGSEKKRPHVKTQVYSTAAAAAASRAAAAVPVTVPFTGTRYKRFNLHARCRGGADPTHAASFCSLPLVTLSNGCALQRHDSQRYGRQRAHCLCSSSGACSCVQIRTLKQLYRACFRCLHSIPHHDPLWPWCGLAVCPVSCHVHHLDIRRVSTPRSACNS